MDFAGVVVGENWRLFDFGHIVEMSLLLTKTFTLENAVSLLIRCVRNLHRSFPFSAHFICKRVCD